jgi:ATP-dependent RNA helicase DeaD
MGSPTRDVTATGFGGLGLAESLVKAVTELGYEEPTPIQREAIPLILSGRDLLAQAATGTGKTAAFALPMIHHLQQDASKPRHTRGLVLVPTRELAMQVAEAIHKYARGTGISVVRFTEARRFPSRFARSSAVSIFAWRRRAARSII